MALEDSGLFMLWGLLWFRLSGTTGSEWEFLYMTAVHRARAEGRAAREGTQRGPPGIWAGCSHVAGLGKLGKVFPGSEDRKDVPQGRSGMHEAWQPERDLSAQGNS